MQMEGVSVFSPKDWESLGKDGTTYAAEDLKKCLEGLARHLFGKLAETILVIKFDRKYVRGFCFVERQSED